MILIDTSIWVAHLRKGEQHLEQLLLEGTVLTHPFVIGELACGRLKNRAKILSWLHSLPSTVLAEHQEVLTFMDLHALAGLGLGWVDVHLLTSTRLTGALLWTNDKPLRDASARLNISYRYRILGD